MAATATLETDPANTRKKILRNTSGEQRNRLLVLNKLLSDIQKNRAAASWYTVGSILCFMIGIGILVANYFGYDGGEDVSSAITIVVLAFLAGAALTALRLKIGEEYIELVYELQEKLHSSDHKEEDIAWLEAAEPGTALVIAKHLARMRE